MHPRTDRHADRQTWVSTMHMPNAKCYKTRMRLTAAARWRSYSSAASMILKMQQQKKKKNKRSKNVDKRPNRRQKLRQ